MAHTKKSPTKKPQPQKAPWYWVLPSNVKKTDRVLDGTTTATRCAPPRSPVEPNKGSAAGQGKRKAIEDYEEPPLSKKNTADKDKAPGNNPDEDEFRRKSSRNKSPSKDLMGFINPDHIDRDVYE